MFFSVRSQISLVTCKIQDNGLGIEEKDLSRIFDPLHRGDNVQKIKGTGLGLSIVKIAVETLRGELDVESEPGRGTSFHGTLNCNNPKNYAN